MPTLRPRVARSDKPQDGRIMVAGADQDSLLSAIVKWIPVEVLTVYKMVDGFIPTENYSFRIGFTIAAFVLTSLWIGFATKPSGERIAWRQVLLAPIAFGCWSVAMQADTLKHIYPGWEMWEGSVTLAVGTLLLPILDGVLKALGMPQSQ